jgi:hypothetical protein
MIEIARVAQPEQRQRDRHHGSALPDATLDDRARDPSLNDVLHGPRAAVDALGRREGVRLNLVKEGRVLRGEVLRNPAAELIPRGPEHPPH